MKNEIDLNVTKSNKLFFILEILMIAVISIFNIVEIILIFDVNQKQSTAELTQHYNYIHNKFNISAYVSEIKILKNKDDCEEGYEILDLLTINKISNANLTNITDIIKLRDFEDKENELNSTFREVGIFSFDVNIAGNEYVELLYQYNINKWKSKYICQLRMGLGSNAIFISEVDKDCNNEKNYKMVDCGNIYNDKYKFCLRKDKIMFNNNGTKIIDHYISLNKTISDEEFRNLYCPISDISVLKDGEVYEYVSSANLSNTFDFDIKYSKFNENKNNLVSSEIRTLLTNKYWINPNPIKDLPEYSENNKTILSIDSNYTVLDSFSKIIDEIEFINLYNDTFYEAPLIVKKDTSTNYYYYPQPLTNLNNSAYLLPIDSSFLNSSYINADVYSSSTRFNYSSSYQVKYHLTSYSFPFATEEFINKAINNKYILNYSSLIDSLTLYLLPEVIHTIIAWLFIKLFILFFYEYKIRVSVILDYLKNTVSFSDYESDKITKYTSKFLFITVYIVVFFALFFEKTQTFKISSKLEYLIDNNAFNDEFLNSILENYKSFIDSIKNTLIAIMIMDILSLVLQLFIILTYFMNIVEKEVKETINSEEKEKLD